MVKKYKKLLKSDKEVTGKYFKGQIISKKVAVDYVVFACFINIFLLSNTFTSNTRLKLVKNQANTKQHQEAELLLFENNSPSSSKLSSKNMSYSKK